MKTWIENTFSDFERDKKLMGMLISFIGKTLPATGYLEQAKALRTDITNVTQVSVHALMVLTEPAACVLGCLQTGPSH